MQAALRSPTNRAVLARIVRYSVLTQKRTAAQLTPGNYATAEGSSVTVEIVNGVVRINEATVTGPDVKVVNGVLHAIDQLLIPPTLDLNTLVRKIEHQKVKHPESETPEPPRKGAGARVRVSALPARRGASAGYGAILGGSGG